MKAGIIIIDLIKEFNFIFPTMLKQAFSLPLIASLGTLLLIPSVSAENLCQGAKLCYSTDSTIHLAQTKTAENLRQIAQAITVRVYTGDTSGSGVLIAKNEQTYTVITNAHVVKRGQPYRIQTPDGTIHQATLQTSEDALTGNDLAVLQCKRSGGDEGIRVSELAGGQTSLEYRQGKLYSPLTFFVMSEPTTVNL